MLDQLLTGSHVAGRVHGVDGAALRVDVRELRQGSLLEIAVEFVRMDKSIHGVILDPLVERSVLASIILWVSCH